MEKIGYVYLTTNLVNGKMYVGQHLSEGFDTGYKGSGTYIKRAFDKYGWDNFKCEVICWCSTQTQLNEVEDNYIKLLDTMVPNGYNLKGGGANGRYSKEARKNISEGRKGKHPSVESRKKMSQAQKGRVSPNKGKKASEETRKKMSEANKGRIPWNKGKHHTEESRKKMSQAQKGRVFSEETRRKLSEAAKGRIHTEETLKKLSEYRKKYFENEENRIKQSEALKGREPWNKGRTYTITNGAKKVYQYTTDGKFVKEWESAVEVHRILGYDASCIRRCCRRIRKTYKKFIWSREPLN